jgi:hypothetical protein
MKAMKHTEPGTAYIVQVAEVNQNLMLAIFNKIAQLVARVRVQYEHQDSQPGKGNQFHLDFGV